MSRRERPEPARTDISDNVCLADPNPERLGGINARVHAGDKDEVVRWR